MERKKEERWAKPGGSWRAPRVWKTPESTAGRNGRVKLWTRHTGRQTLEREEKNRKIPIQRFGGGNYVVNKDTRYRTTYWKNKRTQNTDSKRKKGMWQLAAEDQRTWHLSPFWLSSEKQGREEETKAEEEGKIRRQEDCGCGESRLSSHQKKHRPASYLCSRVKYAGWQQNDWSVWQCLCTGKKETKWNDLFLNLWNEWCYVKTNWWKHLSSSGYLNISKTKAAVDNPD